MTISAYLASTPLHILNSIALASKQPGEHHLLILDQANVDDNLYFKSLMDWPGSPFRSIDIYPGRIRKARARLKQRKQIFQRIDAFVERHQPRHIYTGNDRRIEFQYLMHQCERSGWQPHGCYMDEGTFTYVGRKASSGFGDKYVDNLLKKLAYGFWWRNPPTVGGSGWIQTVYAAYPELVVPELKRKERISLPAYYRNNEVIADFSRHFLKPFNVNVEQLATTDLLITTPHESLIAKLPGYVEMIHGCIEQALEQGKSVAVKYHPRDTSPDALGIAAFPQVEVLPAAIPFELLCPMMHNVVLVGDVSSTLINASWLTPDITSYALEVNSGNQRFDQLFSNLGIKVIPHNTLGQYIGTASWQATQA